jgi:O-antigen ligase
MGLKQESAAYWWLCIYIFFEYVRPQAIYPAISIIPWAQISLLLAIATAFRDPSLKWVKNPESNLLILFLIVVLLSSLFAFSPSISWGKIDLVFNWVIVYILIVTIVNTEKRFLVFLLLFLLVSFKMSQHGFRSFASRGFSFAGWGVRGAPGWFSNSGEFGIQMTIFVPLAIAFIMALKDYWGRYKRWFFYLMPFTGLVTIVATSSRGAQLAIAGIGVWFLLKSRMGIKALISILVLGWALYMVVPQEQMERFTTMGEDSTSLQRIDYWNFGLDTVREHPVLGIGLANWTYYCWFMNPEGLGPQKKCERAHNSFIQASSELGMAGFVVLLLMIMFIFILNARTRHYSRNSENKFILYISHGLDGGLVGFMISGFFISALFYPFFWMQLAMTVALHEVSRNQVVANID